MLVLDKYHGGLLVPKHECQPVRICPPHARRGGGGIDELAFRQGNGRRPFTRLRSVKKYEPGLYAELLLLGIENLEYFSNQGTAWITPKDLSMNGDNKFISKGEIDVSDKGLKAASLKIMPKGTILLSSRAPVGYMAIARDLVTTNQGFKSFVPKADYSTPFIFYTIKNSLPEIVNNASGSTFKEISGGTLKTIKTCLPEKLIINNFTDKVSPIFERQNVLELENQQLASLRDWLLPMLMNGQVRVGDSGEKKVEYEVEEEMRMAAEPEE